MIEDLRGKLTLSVPEAGRQLYGIGRDAAYAAASRGEIPILSMGKTKRVPTPQALKTLGFTDEHIAAMLGIDHVLLQGRDV